MTTRHAHPAKSCLAQRVRRLVHRHVVAVFEGGGVAREVGLAAIDKDTTQVMLLLVSDTFHSKNIVIVIC